MRTEAVVKTSKQNKIKLDISDRILRGSGYVLATIYAILCIFF